MAAAALEACGAVALVCFGLTTSTAAPVCSGIESALCAAESAAENPAFVSHLWSRIASPGAYPFGAARLPALVRFSAAVVALGGTLLILLEVAVHGIFAHVEEDGPRGSAASSLWPASVALCVGLGARSASDRGGSPPHRRAPWRPLAMAGLIVAGGLLSDALAALGLVGLVVSRAGGILHHDGQLLMQATRDVSDAVRYELLLRRAAELPGLCAAYDGCFWDLDGTGAVGALRCTMEPGVSSLAVSVLRQRVRALFSGTRARELTVQLEFEERTRS